MPHLRPCAHCARHVRANETRCPFCEGVLAIEERPLAVPRTRLGRSARMAFGAAASISLAACGGSDSTTTTPPTDAKSDSVTGDTATSDSTGSDSTGSDSTSEVADDSGAPDTFNSDTIAKPYGAPPAEGLV